MNQYDQNRLNDHPEIKPYFNDIDVSTAARAYNHTSQFPERAGSIIRSDYAIDLINDREEVFKTVEKAIKRGATVVDDYQDSLEAWFQDHRTGVKQKYLAYLNSHSNVASSFICGPANFPVARMQKRSQWADNHFENIGKYRYSSKKRILKQLLPHGDGTEIRTDDPDAVSKIDLKIKRLEDQRDRMKAVNKAVRKFYKKNDKPIIDDPTYKKCIAAIMGLGFDEGVARKSIEPDFMGYCIPFAPYTFSNLSAELRRLKSRSKEVEQTKAVEIDDKFDNGIEVNITDDGKIAIHFGYKPDQETRTKIKSHAFKWSRFREAWVRKLTANAAADYQHYVKPVLQAL